MEEQTKAPAPPSKTAILVVPTKEGHLPWGIILDVAGTVTVLPLDTAAGEERRENLMRRMRGQLADLLAQAREEGAREERARVVRLLQEDLELAQLKTDEARRAVEREEIRGEALTRLIESIG